MKTKNNDFLFHNPKLMQGENNFLTGLFGDVFQTEEGQANIVVRVEIDNESLLKIAGLGLGFIVANKLIQKF
jgi:hypothetical protein